MEASLFPSQKKIQVDKLRKGDGSHLLGYAWSPFGGFHSSPCNDECQLLSGHTKRT
jgi:hypothetical protein